LLSRCTTKLPSPISKNHHSAQLHMRWRFDLSS
jgi:hypothetical protein